jgi:hypothetical protein
MTDSTRETAHKRIRELALEPETSTFVLSYLISALDERAWPLLVQAALEYRDDPDRYQEASDSLLEVLRKERWS